MYGNKLARAILVLVFLVAVALKVQHSMDESESTAGAATSLLSLLEDPVLVAVEIATVILLLTRYWALGCVSTMAIVTFGLLLHGYAVRKGDVGGGCGCFGSIILSPAQHMLVASCVFVLAGGLLLRQHAKTG